MVPVILKCKAEAKCWYLNTPFWWFFEDSVLESLLPVQFRWSTCSRKHVITVSVHNAISFVALIPGVRSAIQSASSQVVFGSNYVAIEKSIGKSCNWRIAIHFRAFRPGYSRVIHLSRRFGRRSAGSIHYALWVIPMTAIRASVLPPSLSSLILIPSISVRRTERIRSNVPYVVLSFPHTLVMSTTPGAC